MDPLTSAYALRGLDPAVSTMLHAWGRIAAGPVPVPYPGPELQNLLGIKHLHQSMSRAPWLMAGEDAILARGEGLPSAPWRTRSPRASRTAVRAWLTKRMRGSRQSRASRSIPASGWLTDDPVLQGRRGPARRSQPVHKSSTGVRPVNGYSTERSPQNASYLSAAPVTVSIRCEHTGGMNCEVALPAELASVCRLRIRRKDR